MATKTVQWSHAEGIHLSGKYFRVYKTRLISFDNICYSSCNFIAPGGNLCFVTAISRRLGKKIIIRDISFFTKEGKGDCER